jgi:L-ribulokinase
METHAVYQELYGLYMRVHDAFGVPGSTGDLTDIMKRLLDLKQRVSQE